MARLKSPSFVIFKYDKAQHTQPAFSILAKSCPKPSGRSRKDLELLIDA